MDECEHVQSFITVCRGTRERQAKHFLLEMGMQAALFEGGEICMVHQEFSGGKSAMGHKVCT